MRSNHFSFSTPFIFFILLFSISVSPVFAKDAEEKGTGISGIVLTSDGQPAAGVSVIIKELSKGTLTNESGEFTFRNVTPGKYKLEASLVGTGQVAATVNVLNGKMSTVTLTLSYTSQKLEEVIVTSGGNRFARKESEDVSKMPLSKMENLELYNSNFGFTMDLVVKPEVIAPAAWVAAPILPNTVVQTRTDFLLEIAELEDEQLADKMRALPKEFEMPADLGDKSPAEIREVIKKWLRRDKVVAKGYQHVDGTSFAAPIVSSVVAQMLEANPDLSPAAVRQILMSTADRVRHASVLRQGCGVVNARRAVEEASRVWTPTQISELRPPRVDGDRLSFIYVNPLADSVHLVGDLNAPSLTTHPMEQILDGLWRIDIEAPTVGRYRYKFLIDGNTWVEDPANLFKQPNIYGGFDSILTIA